MVTQLAIRITPDEIGPDDLGDVTAGISEIVGLVGDKYVRDLRDGHPAVEAWDALLEEAKEEIAPQVEALILAAIRKRLPWSWEPVR